MVATTATKKRERLEARITPEQKALFQRAAGLSGRTLTDFVVTSLEAAAAETIEAHEGIKLSPRDSIMFVEPLLNPTGPNGELRKLAKEYRSFFGT